MEGQAQSGQVLGEEGPLDQFQGHHDLSRQELWVDWDPSGGVKYSVGLRRGEPNGKSVVCMMARWLPSRPESDRRAARPSRMISTSLGRSASAITAASVTTTLP